MSSRSHEPDDKILIVLVQLVIDIDSQALRRMDVAQRRALMCRFLEKRVNEGRLRLDSVLGAAFFPVPLSKEY
jgi:hypothetical protein